MHKLLALSIAVASASCAIQSETVADSQHLFGSYTFVDCTPSEVTFLRNAIAAAEAIAASPAYEACLARDLANYVPCNEGTSSRDPAWTFNASAAERVRGILKALRIRNDLKVSCVEQFNFYTGDPLNEYASSDHVADYCAPAQIDNFTFSPKMIDPDAAAGRIFFATGAWLHETLHAHGFHHGSPQGPCLNQTWDTELFNRLTYCAIGIAEQTKLVACPTTAFQTCNSNTGHWVSMGTQATMCECVASSICEDCTDIDNDTIGDRCDACPNDPTPDVDGDGTCSTDNCPTIRNSNQKDSDGDRVGDVCDRCPFDKMPDFDDDGVCGTDNCLVKANFSQSDQDHDGLGDVCDSDRDGDGVKQPPYGNDNCPDDPNLNQANADGDRMGDACDCEPNSPMAAPGVYAARLPETCSPSRERRWNDIVLDDRLASFAAAVADTGGALGFPDAGHLTTCKWGSCLNPNPRSTPAYSRMMESIQNSRPSVHPPAYYGKSEFITFVLGEPGITSSKAVDFLRRRFDVEGL